MNSSSLSDKPDKPIGFYIKDNPPRFKTLGFAWVDKKGVYRYVESSYFETDPLMAASFLDMFSSGLKKRIRDGIDRR